MRAGGRKHNLIAARNSSFAAHRETAGHRSSLVEMGESRTPRPEPFAGDHYERVRWLVVDRSNEHRHPAERSSHVPLDRAWLRTT